MDYIKLGLRIRSRRRELNMTQASLAEAIGVSTSFIGHIERGSRKLSLETLVHLCRALQTNPDTLLSFASFSFSPEQPLTKKEMEQVYALLHFSCQLVRAGTNAG